MGRCITTPALGSTGMAAPSVATGSIGPTTFEFTDVLVSEAVAVVHDSSWPEGDAGTARVRVGHDVNRRSGVVT
jgi:hypothetical protein